MNFIELSNHKIMEHASTCNDLGEKPRDDYLENVTNAHKKGFVHIEKRQYGYAIICKELSSASLTDSKLFISYNFRIEIIFINEHHRKQGNGHEFINELIKKYCIDGDLRGHCFGERRRKFFENCGFTTVQVPNDVSESNGNVLYELYMPKMVKPV